MLEKRLNFHDFEYCSECPCYKVYLAMHGRGGKKINDATKDKEICVASVKEFNPDNWIERKIKGLPYTFIPAPLWCKQHPDEVRKRYREYEIEQEKALLQAQKIPVNV